MLAGLVTHSFFFFLSLWVRLRGSSQGAGKVGCWCGSVGRRHCQCRGSCWGASRSEPCRRLSLLALESARTVAVPTEEGRKRKVAICVSAEMFTCCDSCHKLSQCQNLQIKSGVRFRIKFVCVQGRSTKFWTPYMGILYGPLHSWFYLEPAVKGFTQNPMRGSIQNLTTL